MIISRWQGTQELSLDKIKKYYHIREDQDFKVEKFDSGTVIKDHYHHLLEIRIITDGQLLCNISGNQLLLRPGDRIEIPANTKHAYNNNYPEACTCLVGYYSF